MSNRPKGFKRMPIFYIDKFNYVDNSSRIKSTNERLPADEYYHRLVKQAKNIAKQYFRFNHKRIGNKRFHKILNIIKNRQYEPLQ